MFWLWFFLRKTKRALTLDLTFIYLLRPVHELELSDCPWLSVAGVRHFKLPQQVLRHVIFSQRIHHKALKYWNIIAMVNGGNRLVSVRSDVYLLLGFACGSMNEWVKMGKVSVHRLSPSLTSCSFSPMNLNMRRKWITWLWLLGLAFRFSGYFPPFPERLRSWHKTSENCWFSKWISDFKENNWILKWHAKLSHV